MFRTRSQASAWERGSCKLRQVPTKLLNNMVKLTGEDGVALRVGADGTIREHDEPLAHVSAELADNFKSAEILLLTGQERL